MSSRATSRRLVVRAVATPVSWLDLPNAYTKAEAQRVAAQVGYETIGGAIESLVKGQEYYRGRLAGDVRTRRNLLTAKQSGDVRTFREARTRWGRYVLTAEEREYATRAIREAEEDERTFRRDRETMRDVAGDLILDGRTFAAYVARVSVGLADLVAPPGRCDWCGAPVAVGERTCSELCAANVDETRAQEEWWDESDE